MSENLPTSGSLIPREVINLYKTMCDGLSSDIGRTMTLHLKPTKTDCPNCDFDFTLNSSNRKYKSTNPNTLNGALHKAFLDGQRCPVCENKGFIMTPRTEEYTALISKRLKEEEILAYQITNKNSAKTHTVIESYKDMIECETALIDGKVYKRVSEPKKTGLKDLNRVITIWTRAD